MFGSVVFCADDSIWLVGRFCELCSNFVALQMFSSFLGAFARVKQEALFARAFVCDGVVL